MNSEQLKLSNEAINKLVLHGKITNKVTIEGTVDSGFEKVALTELLMKHSDLSETDYCIYPGRIYFNINESDLNKLNNLRSMDHFSIITYSENFNFTHDKNDDLELFRNLAKNIDMDRILNVWSNFIKKSSKNCELKFRITGIRSYRHSFSSMDAAAVFGGEINDRFHWPVSMTHFDLEILLYIVSERVTVAFKITKLSNHKRNIVFFGPTTLRATVCYNLLLLAKPKPGDIIVDPLCGGGSIPIECAISFPNTIVFSGDNHEKAIERAANNIQQFPHLTINHFAWDATNLPFKESSIDIIVSDLPFGKRSGNCNDNRILYMNLLHEFGRVVKPDTGRMVLLTNDRKSLLNALNRCKVHFWNLSQVLAVKLGGLKPLVACLKRNKTEYHP